MDQIIERPFGHTRLEETAVLSKVSGTVKWYNRQRGYGFVVAEGMPDIFLGQVAVEEAGFGIPADGCSIVAMVQTRGKGLSCKQILELSGPTVEIHRPSAVETIRDIQGPRLGTVKLFKSDVGYGFITVGDDVRDIFVHVSTLEKIGIHRLLEGERVEVKWGTGPRGLTAVEIARVSRQS
ncbi:CspA family cold shock protein [Bradyrhizobium sp. USDA 4341]